MAVPEALRIFVGHDRREEAAYEVARRSILEHASVPLTLSSVSMRSAERAGLYWRPTEVRNGQLWDVISEAPMSTEFAIARFLVPYLCHYEGHALFCDCDFLFRADVGELFALADPRYAVQVVKHHYVTGLQAPKMDGRQQTSYPRKNWSSLMLWNCGHAANRMLSPEMINCKTGRWLHGFSWLDDEMIGSLPIEWNWLELDPKAVHFTLGTPDFPGHERAQYADEWRSYLTGER